MEAIGSLASLITVIGLTKEIGTLIRDTLQGCRAAPREFQSISSQIDLIQLELECLLRLQDDIQQNKLQFSPTDVKTLKSLFKSSLDNIQSIHHQCVEKLPKGKSFGTRLNWALADRKTCESLVRQVQSAETALCTTINIIHL